MTIYALFLEWKGLLIMIEVIGNIGRKKEYENWRWVMNYVDGFPSSDVVEVPHIVWKVDIVVVQKHEWSPSTGKSIEKEKNPTQTT